MKIAFTTDSFVEGHGGVSTAVAALARTLRQRGHQVIVYSATDSSHNHTDPVLIGSWTLRYERFHAGRTPVDLARWTRWMESYDAAYQTLSDPLWQKYYLQPRSQSDGHDRPLPGSQV